MYFQSEFTISIKNVYTRIAIFRAKTKYYLTMLSLESAVSLEAFPW